MSGATAPCRVQNRAGSGAGMCRPGSQRFDEARNRIEGVREVARKKREARAERAAERRKNTQGRRNRARVRKRTRVREQEEAQKASYLPFTEGRTPVEKPAEVVQDTRLILMSDCGERKVKLITEGNSHLEVGTVITTGSVWSANGTTLVKAGTTWTVTERI